MQSMQQKQQNHFQRRCCCLNRGSSSWCIRYDQPDQGAVAGHILVEGQGIGTQKISANLCVCHNEEDLKNFKVGDIIVAKDTSNAMMTQMREASGLIVEASGENCHAAIARIKP